MGFLKIYFKIIALEILVQFSHFLSNFRFSFVDKFLLEKLELIKVVKVSNKISEIFSLFENRCKFCST